MSTIIVSAFLVVLLTLFLFSALVLALYQRPRHHEHYSASPESKSTPLGYYSAQQDRRVTQGLPGKRVYFDEAPTEKMEARK